MKFPILSTLALSCALLAGCASWQGQVAYPNSRFAALPEVEPAALPKDEQGNAVLDQSSGGMAAKAGAGAYVPILGQVVIGSQALHMVYTPRDALNLQDPPRFVTVHPVFTSGTWDNAVTGVLSAGGATLSTSVGVKLSAGQKGIPIGNNKAITLDVGSDATIKLSNLRVVRLNIANLDYVRALADASSNQDVYFVGELLVGDLSSAKLVGANISLVNPAGGALDPTLHANYQANYSGIGLVLGATFNKLTTGGEVNFAGLRSLEIPENMDMVTAIDSASIKLRHTISPRTVMKQSDMATLELEQHITKLKAKFREFGVSNPELVLSRPYTTRIDSHGNIVLSPIDPFMTGSETFVVDKVAKPENSVSFSDSDLGEHQLQYAVVSGNKLYAFRTTVVLGTQRKSKVIREERENREVSYLSWIAVDPASATGSQ